MEKERVEEVKAPGPHGGRGMPRPKIENPGKILKRLLGFIFRHYGVHLVLVVFCIVASASS